MKLKIYLVIAAVFLLGMLSGGLLVMQYVQFKIESLTSSSTRDVYKLILNRLDRELDLSDPQEEKVGEILEGAADEIEPLRTEFREGVLAMLRKNRLKIEGELDREQQEKFEKMMNSIIEKLNLEEDLEQAEKK